MAEDIRFSHAVDSIGVYGHKDPDLDCLTSMWLVSRFLLPARFPERSASLQFVPHTTLNKIAKDPATFPIIVDGGKIYDPAIYRFDTHGDVRLKKECAASLVARELAEVDRKSLEPLIESVRIYDTGEKKARPTHLPEFFRLLHGSHGPIALANIWYGVLDKWYGRAVVEPQHIEDALSFTKVYGSVVVVPSESPRNISTKLFQKGYEYVVYETREGIGVVARTRLPFRFAQRVMERLEKLHRGTEFATWFFHPTGYMACRGSSKSPVATASSLTVDDLVAIIHDLSEESKRIPTVAVAS